ncbi:MAG: ABC transporter ATP-binding protein/permease [Lachnospiraceae bacterium]|nr:ABC transporter ATP-binding protein/permease [Lachnospiraceae bacterium]
MDKNNTRRLRLFGIVELWPFVRKYRTIFIRMVVIGVVVSVFDSIYPLFNRYAINHFVGEKTLDTLPYFIALMIACFVSQGILNYINVCDCSKIEMFMDRDLRNSAFNHLQTVSLSYFNQNNVGYIHARVMSDSGKIGEMMAWHVMNVVWFGSYIVFAVVVMFMVNVKLALIIFAMLPVAMVIMALFQKKLTFLNRQVREQNSKITAHINEGITGVKSIKTLAIEDKMDREFYGETKTMRKLSVRTAHVSAMFTATITLISSLALAAVIWAGGNMTTAQVLEVGTFSVFMSYALNMLDPIQNIVNSIANMIGIRVNIERYLNLMDTTGEVRDREDVIAKYGDAFDEKRENWEKLIGEVDFENVSFHYPDGDEMVLENFTLHVPAGTNVAIVGETGAGKSTLINLVCRFFEPTSGRVLIDGRDSRDRSLSWLHANLGYVLQTPHLFSGTIRDNLKYGNPDATDEQIMEALKTVAAEHLLDKLDEGLDTEIGEGGDFLSTGEKQLLSIARALLADPRILILDEATSSIDTQTEKAIQDAIRTVIQNRTSFVIAHRLSTIVNADIILLVHEGKIVERGTHAQLMKAGGEYYKLFTRQYEDLIVNDNQQN